MTPKRASPKQTAARERAYEEELTKAFSRIGRDSFEATAWLVQFAQTSIDSLSQGELMDLGYELNYLADFRLIPGETSYWGRAASDKDWGGRKRFEGEGYAKSLNKIVLGELSRPPMDHPSLDQIKSLQQFVAELLAGRLKWSSFRLELPPLTVIAVFPKVPRTPTSTTMVLTLADSPRYLFTHNVALLLLKHAYHIRRCPNPSCQRIFFADRKNKMHCSSRCQNTAAVRRLRQSASYSTSKRGKISSTSKNPKAKTLKKKGD